MDILKRGIRILLVLTIMLSACGGISVTAFADGPNEATDVVAGSAEAEEPMGVLSPGGLLGSSASGNLADFLTDAENIDAGDIDVQPSSASVNVGNKAVSSTASDLSGLAYTVDFEYTDPETGKRYTYHLEGAGSITLKELAVILGITTPDKADEFISNVADVRFSNEDLLKIQQSAHDGWVLNSLAPFSSEEALNIPMKNGAMIGVRVTDVQESANLSDFLTNAVIVGATQNENGQYVVEQGKDYSIILSFAEGSSYQFDNDGTLTYQMPDGIKIIHQQTGPLKINIVYKGKTYQVDANFVLTTDGRLSITFDQDDPDYPRLEESTNVSFRFTYHAQFDGSEETIKFSDDVERDIVFDEPEPGQAYVQKTATYDEKTGTFHYTITVRATGNVANVNVKDTVLGNALIVDPSIVITGNSTPPTGGATGTGFEYTFPSMAEGEEITIKYDARVNFEKDDGDGKITADQTKNTVTVDPDPGDPHSSEYSREINFKTTVKSDGTEAGTTDDGDKIINWSIDYNQLALAAAAGDTIRDTISAGSAQYMKYYGNGITVEVRDKNGNIVRTDNIAYEELTAHSDSSWTYTIPSTDTTPYIYHITYRTVVDMDMVNGLAVPVTLNNDGNGDGGSVTVGPTAEIGVTKDVESFTTEEINWVSTLNIPETGLSQAVVTDTLPVAWFNSANHFDFYKDGTLSITGLLPGESYTVDTSEEGKVKITFFKDTGKTQTGLQEKTGGRSITVKLTTKVNQEWLEYGYDPNNPNYFKDHENKIALNGTEARATVTFGKPGIEKKGQFLGGGSFKYTVILSGVSETPVSVLDTFDTSLLEIDPTKVSVWDDLKIWGGNQYDQSLGQMPISYTETETGLILTANSVPMQENGNYYPYYKMIYYLRLKDGVDLEQLAIAHGGQYDVINTATWGDHETEYDYKVVYDALDKKLLNAGELGGTSRTAQYMITFNSAKATLNGGEPMEMKDVLSANLSLDYSSVQITTDPAGAEVPYSISGGKDEAGVPDGTTVATYIIPDATSVTITYDADVRGNGSQKIVNKVSINGYDETEENTHDYGATTEGQGAIASFKIVKVDGYDANKKLSGVKFKVFAENQDIDFGENANHAKEIVLETDENGEIIFDGEDYNFFFNEVYHVQEIEEPEDYGKIGFDYLVRLTNDMAQVDYGAYVYYFSDTMQIKNWPLEGLVVEKQVESEEDEDLDRNYNFKVYILNEDGSVNTAYNEKNGDDQFQNGVADFMLKHNEQKMFWGFQKGTKYKVEEVFTDGDGNEFTVEVGYDIFDEEGEVIRHETETGTSHSGTLTQSAETIVFTNIKGGKGSLKIQKTVTENGSSTLSAAAKAKLAGDYTFIVYTDENCTIPLQKDGADVTVTLTIPADGSSATSEEITDIPAGTYYIKETSPITSNPSPVTNPVTVTVEAGKTGNAAVIATITNDYKHVEAAPEVNKSINVWPENVTSFDFTLTAGTNDAGVTTPMPASGGETASATSTTSPAVFGTITFEAPGTYNYIIKEVVPEDDDPATEGIQKDGVTYTNAEYPVQIAVEADSTTGQLMTPVIQYGSALENNLTVTNTYTAKGVGEAKVKKLLDGREWTTNDSFEFTISPVGSAPAFPTSPVTITKDSTSYTESFGKVTFTEAGTYQWTVSETHKGETIDGVAYASDDETITIVVVDDGQGHLVADDGSALAQTAEFTNTYAKSGVGEAKVKKLLDGREWTANDSFEFTITPAEGSPAFPNSTVTVTKDSTDYTESFGTVTFTEAGTYQWTVTETHKGETIDGVAYASDDETITIVVVDDGQGNLVADDGSALAQTAEFTNTYSKSGEGEIKVQKILEGREWTDDDEFTFTISAAEGTPMPAETSITIKKADEDQMKSFGEITFTAAGEYSYTVKETKGTADGVTYDETEHTVTIKVKDDGQGNLVADSTPLIQTEKFTNTYAKSGEGEIKVQKILEGREWTDDDEFTFTISAAEGTPMPAEASITIKKADEDQIKSFGEITFTAAGEYSYTVKETKGTADGVTYDETEHTVTIKVKDDGQGNLVADGTPLIQTEKFTNTYAKSGQGEIKVQKILEGREWTDDDEFTFTISAAEGTPMPAETSITIKKADEDQIKSFGEITFTAAGEYSYTVKETKGTADGVTYDETEHTVTIKVKDDGQGNLVADADSALVQTVTFTNTYAKSGQGEIKVQKILEGREWTDDDEFTFTISAAEGTPMPAETSITIKKADEDQIKSFGEITFTAAGEYSYTVKETKGTADGVTYDETEHTVTIKVKDDGQGNLVADGTPLIQTEKFTNTYAKSGEGEIKVQKILEGREWTDDDEFTFTISAAEGTPMPAETSITIKKADEDQIKSFGEITFTAAGEYSYTVKETKGTADGVTYDETEHTVTIKVKDDGQGNLVADGTPLIQTEKFTNTYAKSGEGEIKVQKILEGREWTDDDEFTFTISATEGTPMPAEASITIKKADEDQIKSFGEITFTAAGEYSYTVKETKGTADGVTYDETEHTVTIKVKDDGKGNLVADTDSALVQTVTFTNTYAKSGQGEIKVQKILEGREWTDDDEFTFTISAAEGTPMPAETSITIKKADEDQIKSFGEITFTAAGEYSYTVKETKGTADGVTYDETEHTVTIKVKDDGQGNLVADGTPLIQTEKFTNTFDAIGKYVPGAKKILYGRKLQANEFRFTLTAVDESGNALTGEAAYSKTVTNAADGTVTFPEINYLLSDLDQVDGHTVDTKKYYRIEEEIPYPEEKDMTYSTVVYNISVTLHDNGNGIITSNPDKKIESIVFTNNYTPERYDYKFSFTKKWAGGREDSIDWVLYSADGTVVHKKFNKKTVSEDEWYYEAWFQSDKELYLIETVPQGYQVRYENIGEHADVTDRCYNGGTIINYKVPLTGDDFKPILWISCVLSGLALLGGSCLILKRKKKN